MAQTPDINKKTDGNLADRFTVGFVPWLIVAAVGFGLYCNSLGSWAFMDPGETYYSEAAREMIESGDYIVPHLNYQTYFSKPILTFWLTAGSYLLFGVNEFAARLPFGLLAMLLVFATFYVTKVIAGARAALLAALICASAPLLVAHAKLSCIDVAFTTFLNLSIYAFILSVFAGKRNWWIALWSSLALGMLTKGPAALLFFAIGTSLYLLLSRPGWKRLSYWFKTTYPVWGIPLFFVLVLPWYVAVWQATKGLFVQVFFLYENLARFQGKTNMHKSNWFYFVGVLGYGIAPWFLLLPQALKKTFFEPIADLWFGGRKLSFKSTYRPYAREMKPKEVDGDALIFAGERDNAELVQSRAVFYLACWSVAVFLFFSFSKTQLDTYAMPLVSPISILIAISMLKLAESGIKNGTARSTSADQAAIANPQTVEKFDPADQEKWDRIWLNTVLWLVCLFSFAAFLALSVLALGLKEASFAQRLTMGITAAATLPAAILQLIQLLKSRLVNCLFAAALTICLLLAYVHPVALQIYGDKKQGNMAKVAGYLPDCQANIALYGPFKPSLIYYLKRPVDTFSAISQFVVGPNPSGRKQYLFADDIRMKDFAGRTDLKFNQLFREGDWAVYELTNGYAARPLALEEIFKLMNQAHQSLTATNPAFGPLTVPLGGGDADWYKKGAPLLKP